MTEVNNTFRSLEVDSKRSRRGLEQEVYFVSSPTGYAYSSKVLRSIEYLCLEPRQKIGV
jgi:hypothetical protein